MLKNRYSSGDSLGGLVLGQQSQRRQKVANRTKQMLEALLRRDSGRGTKKSGKPWLVPQEPLVLLSRPSRSGAEGTRQAGPWGPRSRPPNVLFLHHLLL